MMKTGMKKIAACLVALLMIAQAAPAMMDGSYTSNVSLGSLEGFRDALEIICDGGSYLLIGDEVTLSANEDYQPVWTSKDPAVASVEPSGQASETAVVTAVGAGSTEITATEGNQTKVFRVTVMDPNELAKEQKKEARKENIVIVVNGVTTLRTFNGEAQSHDEYTVSSGSASFDPGKVRLNRDITVTATECGYYKMNLKEADFSYDDDSVNAAFVVYDGFLKIVPAKVMVQVNTQAKEAGQEDPALTAQVTGLCGEDTIEYTISRDPGEEAGIYLINAEGAEEQGNYRIQYLPGILTIEEPAPVATEEPEIPEEPAETDEPVVRPPLNVNAYSLASGELIIGETRITLVADVAGAEESELTIQWQYSTDMENWHDVPGANSLTYTYELDVENASYAWRVNVDWKE